jgi:7,8-dihydroneopterin aldolase/epimerase/oxygenase
VSNDLTQPDNIHHLPYADATRSVRHIFVRDYVISAQIGVWEHEKDTHQKVRISVDLSVQEDTAHHDQLGNVVCYNDIVTNTQKIIAAGHINLVETLAEKIADMALVDPRVIGARVKVEKLEAVKGAASVGVEIERHKKP